MSLDIPNSLPNAWGAEITTESKPRSPLVSIVMGAYNAERFIGEAIQSIIDQTFTDWELIILEDQSPDRTWEVIQSFSDPRIKATKLPTRVGTPSGVRNRLMDLVKTKYIAFLDCDDVYEPNAMADLVEYMESHPECHCAYGLLREIDEESRLIEDPALCYWHELPEHLKNAPDNVLHDWDNILLSRIPLMYQTSLMRTDAIQKIGRINEKVIWDDYYFFIKVFRYNWAGVHRISKHMFRYRLNQSGISKDTRRYKILLSNLPVIVNALFDELKIHELGSKYTRSFMSAKFYKDLCWGRLRVRQHGQIVETAWQALRDPNLSLGDWCESCLPFVLRAVIPPSLYGVLRTIKQRLLPSDTDKPTASVALATFN